MEFFIGETLEWREDAVEGNWPTIHLYSALFSYAGGGETDQWFYFDWAEMWGIPVDEGEGDVSVDWHLWEAPELLGLVLPAAPMSHRADFDAP